MRTSFTIVAALSVLLTGATQASAQRRVPVAGMWALGGSIGGGVPSDPSLNNGLELAGNVESYLTPRVSIRGQLGGAWSDIVGRHFNGTVNPVFVDANVVYNWEGGAWHPFVTGGVGIYHYRSSENGAGDATDTKPGVNLGGGMEYFYSRRGTITFETLYHAVSEVNTPLATFTQGQFWTFGVGLKRYF